MKGAIKRKLSDVCTIIAGQSPESKYYNQDGIGLPFFQGKADFGDLYPTIRTYCSTPTKIAQKNDILLSVRAPVGATNLAPTKVCIGRGLTAIRPTDCLNTKYLLLFFRYFQAELAQKGAGTTFNAISQTVVKNIEIPVPHLEEQERIIGKIEELFSEIDNAVSSLNAVKQKLTAYRHAVYTSAFASFQDCVPLTDYFDISSGITKNPARSKLKIQMPYLRVANVYYNKLDLSEIKKIGVEKNEIAKNLLKSGDLLFVEGNGSKSQIGRVAIWDGSIPDCLHQNHIIKARVQREISVRFVLYYLMSEHGRKQILKVATSSSGLYTLSANKIRNIKIPFCPIEEQQRAASLIEEKLSSCDMISNTICQIFQQAKALKQSVLKSAFEGTLL